VLFKAYSARKKVLGVIDLDDLLLYWRALATDDVIGPELERRFDHVLIDEYQDVNGLQVDIVTGLRRTCREVTAVGDDFQAIYGWRAASVEHILGFPSQFPDATVINLERNYRSSQPILDVANELAAQATRAFPKQLRSQQDGGAQPELLFCRDESAQAVEVCDRVLRAREHGMELRQQAVLMRTSHDSALLELELARRQIPFVKYGGLRYPRGRARQGLDRAVPAGGQPSPTRSPGFACFSSSTASGPRARAAPSTSSSPPTGTGSPDGRRRASGSRRTRVPSPTASSPRCERPGLSPA